MRKLTSVSATWSHSRSAATAVLVMFDLFHRRQRLARLLPPETYLVCEACLPHLPHVFASTPTMEDACRKLTTDTVSISSQMRPKLSGYLFIVSISIRLPLIILLWPLQSNSRRRHLQRHRGILARVPGSRPLTRNPLGIRSLIRLECEYLRNIPWTVRGIEQGEVPASAQPVRTVMPRNFEIE